VRRGRAIEAIAVKNQAHLKNNNTTGSGGIPTGQGATCES
jgi:hypothetical protein